MGVRTGIAWCHHTFNPWWGCVEVSPACDNCYARMLAARFGWKVWGKDAPRRFFGLKHWAEPVQWNADAAAAGERRRVFCASMADVLEVGTGEVGAKLDEARELLWDLIRRTPALDWLLLTKRPAFYRQVPPPIRELANVWPGVTVESPDYTWRLDTLLDVDGFAGTRWVSYEPALAAVDFRPWISRGLRWVIVGGESGPKARPFHLSWAHHVIEHCRTYGAAPFVKQLGARPIYYDDVACVRDVPLVLHDRQAGADPTEWDEDLRVQEVPAA